MPFDPWAGGTITQTPIQYPLGAFGFLTQAYPTVSASLNQYSQPGIRIAKLLTRPAWMRVVYGYRETFRQDDQSSTIVYDVACGGRKACIDYWLGYSSAFWAPGIDPATTPGQLLRTVPDQHPRYPWLYAQNVDLIEPDKLAIVQDPFTIDTATNTAALCPYYVAKDGDGFVEGAMRYAVTYRTLPYEVLTDAEAGNSGYGELSRYVDRQVTYAVQAQPIPNSLTFKFTEGPYSSNFAGNPQKILPTEQLIYRWVDVPDLPRSVILNTVGKVNSDTFDGAPGWPTHAPETLLCHSPKTKRYRSLNGKIMWEIEYRFDKRATGWNSFLAADGEFYRAGIGGDATKPLYKSAPFADLFTLSL